MCLALSFCWTALIQSFIVGAKQWRLLGALKQSLLKGHLLLGPNPASQILDTLLSLESLHKQRYLAYTCLHVNPLTSQRNLPKARMKMFFKKYFQNSENIHSGRRQSGFVLWTQWSLYFLSSSCLERKSLNQKQALPNQMEELGASGEPYITISSH